MRLDRIHLKPRILFFRMGKLHDFYKYAQKKEWRLWKNKHKTGIQKVSLATSPQNGRRYSIDL